MAKKKERDIEKGYSTKQMVAKPRRLGVSLEQDGFESKSQEKEYISLRKQYWSWDQSILRTQPPDERLRVSPLY